MTKIVLTKDQFWKIADLVEKYRLDTVQLEVDHSSGIGANVYVKLNFSGEKIDITDYSSW